MVYPALAQELIERSQHDRTVRQRLLTEGRLFRGYDPEMEAVHLANARRLQEIIAEIGWPDQEQVGEDASQAAWLIVQHAISCPVFMKSALALMMEQQETRTIDPVNLAFLSDRIAMYENRPQAYGTQFVGDERGQLIPYQLTDSVDLVNQRRRQIGLNTVEERLAELAAEWQGEPEKQPTTTERQQEQEAYDTWRRKVGWLST